MTKHLKCVKISIIVGILLFSVFAAVTPNTSAKKLVNVTPMINVISTRAERYVIPTSGVLTINLTVTFDLTGLGSDYVKYDSLLKNSMIEVEVTVQNTNDWVDAAIDNPKAQFKLNDLKPWEKSTTVTLTVDEQAPAFQQGAITVTATSPELDGVIVSIKPGTATRDVTFEVGYWPVIKYNDIEGNFKQCGPMDTVDFPIELENIGNGYTYVTIEVIDMPDGDWTISVPSSVYLQRSGAGEGYKTIIHIKIKPPYGFGFHFDRQSFKIKLTPQFPGTADRPDQVGKSEIKTFSVQSVGMSPGAGYEIPLIVLILVVLFVGIYIFYKRRKK